MRASASGCQRLIARTLSDLKVIAESLRSAGYVTALAFIPPYLVDLLRFEVSQLAQDNDLRPGTIGQGDDNQRRVEVRSDLIYWVNEETSSGALRECLKYFEQLRQALNETLFLGLFEFECHFSLYRAGARYARHLDQFRNDDRRRVSCVLYLNESWDESDGGALRLYVGKYGDYRDVIPHGGTLAVFLSDQFDHEVLPARKARFSVTGWFKVRG